MSQMEGKTKEKRFIERFFEILVRMFEVSWVAKTKFDRKLELIQKYSPSKLFTYLGLFMVEA